LAIVDCTGHGVPGGFMTMLGQSMLSNIILYHHIYSPDEILDEMNDNVIRMLHQDDKDVHIHDGMDMAMLVIDHDTKKITYSGAKRPLVYLQDGELNIIKASKYSIGSFLEGTEKVFEKHEIDFDEGTTVFLYSDGITDQFNESQEYKFSRKRLCDLLITNKELPLKEQGDLLIGSLDQWEGNAPQIDDILIVGFKCQF
jgi:sigma-B regulation protein RsbU (phosphoserine phosphatase)